MNALQNRREILMLLVSILAPGLGARIAFAQDQDEEKKKKKKKKKKKSSKSSKTSSEAADGNSISPEVKKLLQKVERELLAYDTAGARSLLEPELGKNEPALDAAMGWLLMLEKDYNKAATTLNKAAGKTDSCYPQIYLGESYRYSKQAGQSKQAYRNAADKAAARLAKKANDVDALYCLGVAQQGLEDYGSSLQNLQKAQALDSRRELIPYQIGLSHLLNGDFQAAFDNLDKAVSKNSGFAYAYYYRGLAADKIGRKDLLVNDLDRFVALAPDAPEAERARRILKGIRG